jgi:hypothetical protein
MPHDDWFSAPASATVDTGARGSAVTISYTWVHADDGPQEGVLVIANAAEELVTGLWIDTWHQKQAQPLDAVGPAESEIMFEWAYGGDWRWQIVLQAGETLTITMRNIVPADADTGREAISYEAMEMQLLP